MELYYIYIIRDAASPHRKPASPVNRRAWSGLCLIRGSRFDTASAARQLLATVGPSTPTLFKKPASLVLPCLLRAVPDPGKPLCYCLCCLAANRYSRAFGPTFA